MIRVLPFILVAAIPAFAQEPKGKIERVMIKEATGDVACNFDASMLELKDGKILMVWPEFKKGGGDSDFFPGRLVSMTSSDGGRTWRDFRSVVENNAGDSNVGCANLLRLDDGAILLCFMRYHGFNKAKNKYPPASTFARISRDEGKTFTPLATLYEEKNIILASATLRKLSTGRILLPVDRDLSKKGTPDHFEAAVMYSDDAGKTWTFSDNWVDLPKRGAMEPHVEELKNGKVLMVMRTQLGSVYRALSGDGGTTWSKPSSLGVEAPESCPDLVRIPGTGDLLLVYNASKYDPKAKSHFGKRTPLSIAISKDDGETWSLPRHLDGDPGSAYSNPCCFFTKDGKVIINYWTCKYQPSGYMANYPIHLRACIADVAWIYGK